MPSRDPAKIRERGARYRAKNRDKLLAVQAAWRATNRGRLRDYRLRHFYGMSVADVQKLLASQGGECAICPRLLVYPSKGAHVDHDHLTGKVRGVLCRWCNIGLGYVERNDWLFNVKVYLKLEI